MIGPMVYWGYFQDEVRALGEKMFRVKWDNDVAFAAWLVKRDEKERYANMARFWLWMPSDLRRGPNEAQRLGITQVEIPSAGSCGGR